MDTVRNSASSQATKPLLMRLGAAFALLYSAGATLLVALAFAGMTPYVIDGREVSREDWLQLAVPLFAVTIVLMAVIAYALLRERAWSRHVVLAHWAAVAGYGLLVLVLGTVERSLAARVVAEAAVAGAFSAWYFYRKRNVVAYFNSLRSTPDQR